MEESIVGLLNTYEKRVDLIESLVGKFYFVAQESDEDSRVLERERTTLEEELGALLAKNCSIRHKDFRAEMNKVLSSLSISREELFKERCSMMNTVREYLSDQKELINKINGCLSELHSGERTDKDLDNLVRAFKISCNDNGESILRRLRGFQGRVSIYKREQSELNRKLKLLVDRGKELNIEDVRRLKENDLIVRRKSETRLRREEVNRFLSRLKDTRLSNSAVRIPKKRED